MTADGLGLMAELYYATFIGFVAALFAAIKTQSLCPE